MVLLVRDAMNRNVKTVSPDDTVKQAAEKMSKYWMGSVIVIKGDGVEGIMTERDVLNKVVAAGKDPQKVRVREIMTKTIISIEEDKTLDDAIKIMKGNDIKKLPVLKDGRLVGIITTTDIITGVGKESEDKISLKSMRDLKVLVRRSSVDLKREIEKNQVLIFLIPNSLYPDDSVAIIKAASTAIKKCVFVTVTRPYFSILKALKGKGVDTENFFFIDASSGDESTSKGKNYSRVSGPSDLTEILLLIGKSLESNKFEGLIFDSISTLLAYHDEEMVIRFAHSLINKLRKSEVKGIFLCTKEDVKTSLLKNLNMLADYSLDIEKKGEIVGK